MNIDGILALICVGAAALAFHSWPDPASVAFGGYDLGIAYWCFCDWMKSKAT
jgi:hypothetical protein